MDDCRNPSFRLRHTMAVQLRGQNRVECVVAHPWRAGVIVVADRWLYDETCLALTPGAPDIVDAWDISTTSLKGKAKQVAARAEAQAFNDWVNGIFAKPKTWKDVTKLRDLPRDGFLRFSCTRCGRVRLDGIGYLVSAGRVGGRTLAEVERVSRCNGCHDLVTVEIEGGDEKRSEEWERRGRG